MAKNRTTKYYTLPITEWDSYESKCIRNNAPFEIGFIRESNKQPDSLMVYPVKRELKGNLQISFFLVEHTLKNIESMGGYSRYNMECNTLNELELVKSIKGSLYAIYTVKEITRKRPSRKIKPNKYPMTKLIL